VGQCGSHPQHSSSSLEGACGEADRPQRAVRRQRPSQRDRALVTNRIVIQTKARQRAVSHEHIRQRLSARSANPIVIEIELLEAMRGVGAQKKRETSVVSVRDTWLPPGRHPLPQTSLTVWFDASALAMAAAPASPMPLLPIRN